jgi:hypothetical protein
MEMLQNLDVMTSHYTGFSIPRIVFRNRRRKTFAAGLKTVVGKFHGCGPKWKE